MTPRGAILSIVNTVTLYRSHSATAAHVAGTCWTTRREHAEAYADNGGFGGGVLYTVDAAERHVLDLTGDLTAARWTLAESLADHASIVATAERACADDELTGAAAVAEWLRSIVYSSDKGRLYSTWEERPEIRAALESDYDWVTYDDDYPVGCVTWCYLGESALPATVAE